MDLSIANLLPGLEPFFRWCSRSPLGEYFNRWSWAVTSIQTLHLLAIIVVLGAILLLNLQLLGILRGWTASQLARTLSPFVTGGLVAVLLTGLPLFLGNPMRYFPNTAFGPKMLLLAAALLFHYTLYPLAAERPIASKCAAILSLVLWFGAGAAGRTIGWS